MHLEDESTKDPERVVVIGADAAGMSAAHQMLRTAKRTGRRLAVRVLEASEFTSYSACGIPYVVSGEVPDVAALLVRSPEEHRAAGIDLHTGTRAIRVDLEARVVEVEGGDRFDYDQVVVATGAAPVMPPWTRGSDGAPVAGVHAAKTLHDAAMWSERFAAGGRVVVVGGGYIGLEMCEAALRHGLEVTLVTRSRVLSTFAPEISVRVAAALSRAGVRVVEHASVEGVEVAAGTVTGVRTDGTTYACEHVVVALGVRPATEFLAGTGLLQPRNGALRPDSAGRVADRIWAAGDCCEVRERGTGDWVYAALGTHATKAGRVVGENLGGGEATFGGAVGSAITRFSAGGEYLEVARTGVSLRDARGHADDAVTVMTEGTTATGYMPEAEPIALVVSADRATRRLLSVDVVGGRGAGKRVDAAAAVLWYGGTVDDLAWMDLSYAPPVATAWEILQIAARRVAERIDREA